MYVGGVADWLMLLQVYNLIVEFQFFKTKYLINNTIERMINGLAARLLAAADELSSGMVV